MSTPTPKSPEDGPGPIIALIRQLKREKKSDRQIFEQVRPLVPKDGPTASLDDFELDAVVRDVIANVDRDIRKEQIQRYKEDRKERRRIDREVARELDAEEGGEIQIPKGRTLTERLALKPDTTPFRIERFQRMGQRVVFAAPAKGGKTSFGSNLVRSLADGDPFLDRFIVVPVEGSVTLLDFEMAEDENASVLDDWYRDIGIKNTDKVHVVGMRGRAGAFNIIDPKIRSEWAARLREAQTEYLIVDCLDPILDALGLDKMVGVGPLLTALDALLVEAGISETLLIHHMGHSAERSKGDSRLRGWPDAEWQLVLANPEDFTSQRFIRAFGRSVNVPETALLFNPKTKRLAVGDGARVVPKRKATEADILKVVQENPTAGKTDLLKMLTGKEGSVRAELEALVKKGKLKEHEVKSGKTTKTCFSVVGQQATLPAEPDAEPDAEWELLLPKRGGK